MKKPQWFRVLDLLTIGSGGLMVIGALIYIAIVGVQSPNAVQGIIGLCVVGLCFIAIYAFYVYNRKKWLDSFEWFPTYNLMIQPNGYVLPASGEIDGVVWKTIQAWKPFHPNAEALLKSDTNWVYFQIGLNESPVNPARQKVKGLTVAGTHVIEVDFDNATDALESTAFEHELGHIIHGLATGNWDMGEHHRFMEAHGLK